MNQLFDAGRWWLLVGKHWSENRKKYTLSLIAIAGLLLFWFIVILAVDGHRGIGTTMQSTTYYFGLFVVGCLYASILFADLGSKTRGLNYLVVPASHLEKLCCSLFYAVILFFACYTAIFYIVDVLVLKTANAIGYSYWAKHHLPTDIFEPQKIVNVFYLPEHSRSDNDLIYLLMTYFVVQSVFILGSIYFAKFSFIKTVIASLLIGLLITFIVGKLIIPILPPGSYHNGMNSYQAYTVKDTPSGDGIMIYSDAATDKLVSLPGWINTILLFLLKFAFAPLFWLAAYFRLKEKEI
ncbi:MAG: hypothetical protein ABIR15_10045 [Chitinophagaceae bacterium]